MSSVCAWPQPCVCVATSGVTSVRHVRAGAPSVALLLSSASVVELWPHARVTGGGPTTTVSGVEGFGSTDITLRAGTLRRSLTSYESAAHWAVQGDAPGRAVVQVSQHGWQGCRLRLDVSCGQGPSQLLLQSGADAFLAALGRWAERRALAG